MIVECHNYICSYNIAEECIKSKIEIIDGKCASYEKGDSTGEIVEEADYSGRDSK